MTIEEPTPPSQRYSAHWYPVSLALAAADTSVEATDEVLGPLGWHRVNIPGVGPAFMDNYGTIMTMPKRDGFAESAEAEI